MKKTLVFHPFLIAVYVILFHFSINFVEILSPQRELPLPLFFSLLSVTILWFALTPLIKDREKRGLVISVFWLSLFMFGHIVTVMNNNIEDIPVITNSYIAAIVITILMVVSSIILILNKIKDTASFTRYANIMSVMLIIFSVISIIRTTYVEKGFVNSYWKSIREKSTGSRISPNQVKPSIYYIILDTYTSDDILKNRYNFDNSELISYMKNKGFHIIKNGKSNYHTTHLSLASSLNLKYLEPDNDRTNIDSFHNIIFKENLLFNFLKEQGYIVITISSGAPASSLDQFSQDAYTSGDIPVLYNWSQLTEFQWMLVCMTPAQLFFQKKNKIFTPMEVYHKRIVRAFDEIADTSSIDKPVFVFAHILAPHSPLTQKENGVQFSKEYYIDQVKFTNEQVIRVLETLQTNRKTPAIIIIQGDHGPSPKGPDEPYYEEQYYILNAIYLPDEDSGLFDDNLTPVNTFRILLNKYFGGNHDILDNHHYFSTVKHPLRFINVDDKIK